MSYFFDTKVDKSETLTLNLLIVEYLKALTKLETEYQKNKTSHRHLFHQ